MATALFRVGPSARGMIKLYHEDSAAIEATLKSFFICGVFLGIHTWTLVATALPGVAPSASGMTKLYRKLYAPSESS